MPQRVWQYTGPYERWVFGQNLGRPFSFPAIRNWSSRYFAALMDSPAPLPNVSTVKFTAEPGAQVERVDVRYPPLWNNGQGTELAALGLVWTALMTVLAVAFYDTARKTGAGAYGG